MFAVFEALKQRRAASKRFIEITTHRRVVPVQAASTWRTMKADCLQRCPDPGEQYRQGKALRLSRRCSARAVRGSALPCHQDCLSIKWWTPARAEFDARDALISIRRPMTRTARRTQFPPQRQADRDRLYWAPAPSASVRALSLITAPCPLCVDA